jgi:hypothetical protein
MPLSGQAREVKRPPLLVPETARTALEFTPPGWSAEKERLLEGDLNGDGRADAVLVISHGGFIENGPADYPPVKHVLVLALRWSDGKLHRSIVSDAAVLDGDEGGAFGDPFDNISVDKGDVVISHYGGSRDRWSYTHRYRYRNERWMLVHLGFGSQDVVNLEHYDTHEIDLINGLASASEKGSFEGAPKKPEIGGSYYELQALPVDKAPEVDGVLSPDEWPGYAVHLNDRRQGFRPPRPGSEGKRPSATLHAVWSGAGLFVCAEVTGNEVSAGDKVRLITKKGIAIRPLQSKLTRGGNGYVFEARYSDIDVAGALKHDNEYILEEIKRVLGSAEAGDFQGVELPVSIEVVDLRRSTKSKARTVLSTRLIGSPYTGAIRLYGKGTMVLVSDN